MRATYERFQEHRSFALCLAEAYNQRSMELKVAMEAVDKLDEIAVETAEEFWNEKGRKEEELEVSLSGRGVFEMMRQGVKALGCTPQSFHRVDCK